MAAYAFGDFQLDEEERSLRLRGETLPVQPLVLSLLAYLVRHAGRVVPKDELLDALWPGLHVTEGSLQRAASLARSALRAGGLEGALRSLPKLGYRFALDRATLTGVGPSQEPAADPLLDRARADAEARRWAEASRGFAEADGSSSLEPGDLELWAYTLECQGQLVSALPLHARAIERFVRDGQRHKAGQAAARLGKTNLELGHADVGRAWVGRAEELLGLDAPPETEAYVLWMKSRFAVFAGEPEQSLVLIRRAVELAEASSSTSLRALALAYEGFYHMTLGDVATGRARQDQAAAIGLSGEVDPLTGSLIYCSILWTCRTFGDWTRAAQWEPGFEIWCRMAYAEVTGACRLHNADILASTGRLAEALPHIDRAIERLNQEGTWELGDAYRVRGDILAMMGDTAGARRDYQMSKSLGWDVEPGLARLVAAEGDGASAIAAIDRSLAGQGWYGRQRQGWLLASKAQIAAAADRSDVAKAALEELEQWREAASIPATQAMALEARAELLVHEGHVEGAMPVFHLARQLWIGIRHEYHAARLSLRTAELLEQTGDLVGADMEQEAARLTAERIGACGLLGKASLIAAA